MMNNADVEKNLDNKSNSKNFRKGTEPETYGEASAGKYGGDEVDFGNEVGAVENANTDKGKAYEKRMITPKDPSLNAVSMPNRSKMNKKDYGVLKYVGDEDSGKEGCAGKVPVGGTPKPNTIR